MKSYFRFLSRNKLYTFINLAGLVVSLMFIILMGDYTWRQYSIDLELGQPEQAVRTRSITKSSKVWSQASASSPAAMSHSKTMKC